MTPTRKWARVPYLGQFAYECGPYRIEPRWTWRSLGRGRQSSRRDWVLLKDREAIALAARLDEAKELINQGKGNDAIE